jgi:hypothetical protein
VILLYRIIQTVACTQTCGDALPQRKGQVEICRGRLTVVVVDSLQIGNKHWFMISSCFPHLLPSSSLTRVIFMFWTNQCNYLPPNYFGFWLSSCNEKNHALEKVEIAQNKKPLVFSEVMAFLQEYSHTSLRMYGFFL